MVLPIGNQSSGGQQPDNVEDIFNTVDQKTGPAQTPPSQAAQSQNSPFRPVRPNPDLPRPSMNQQSSVFPPSDQSSKNQNTTTMGNTKAMEPGSKKGVKIGLIVLIIVVVLGGGVFGVYWFLTQKSSTPITPTQPVNISGGATNLNAATTNTNKDITNTIVNTNVVVPTPAALDTDQDGLTDTEEVTYGTNPKLADTDVDGLNDYIEVKTYNTDPKNADSDGDTYNDGMEVNKGFNPNGPGRLIDIPSSNTTTNLN